MRVCPVCRGKFPAGSNFCPNDGQQLEDLNEGLQQRDELLGMVLDQRYRLESRLGSGGMGNVYAARHIVIEKRVAVKVLHLEYSKDPRQAERFIREARAASRIGHSNIVDVTDFGRLDNGQIYFVMEYLGGVTLAGELRAHGALETARVIDLTIQICHALQAAHSKGIVHRDLKPENIFIINPMTAPTEDDSGGHPLDKIKLLDFGIAKITWDDQNRRLTRAGSVFGTPQYMSPEQASGKDTDHRGDVYALGCIIYEMLTGELPFIADTFMGTLTKQMFERPIPPRELRPDLMILPPMEVMIMKAMEKDPVDRFQSMKEFTAALESSARQRGGNVLSSLEATEAPAEVIVQSGGTSSPGGEEVHLLVRKDDSPPGEIGASREVAPDRPGGHLHLVLGAAALFLVLTSGGIYLVLRAESVEEATASPARVEPVLAAAPGGRDLSSAPAPRPDTSPAARATESAPDARTTFSITLKTLPPGAVISSGSRVIGKTPRSVRARADVAARFSFRRDGFHDQTLTTIPTRDATHVIRLKRRSGSGTKSSRYGSKKDLRNPFSSGGGPK